VALVAVKGDRTLAQLIRSNSTSTTIRIASWKAQLEVEAADVFNPGCGNSVGATRRLCEVTARQDWGTDAGEEGALSQAGLLSMRPCARSPQAEALNISAAAASNSSVNGVCYMWWDGFPCLALASDPNLPTMQETALRTMARILDFKSLACQESALHGLGHWQGTDDRQVSAIIDGFLEANPGIDARLIGYANSARCGCVL